MQLVEAPEVAAEVAEYGMRLPRTRVEVDCCEGDSAANGGVTAASDVSVVTLDEWQLTLLRGTAAAACEIRALRSEVAELRRGLAALREQQLEARPPGRRPRRGGDGGAGGRAEAEGEAGPAAGAADSSSWDANPPPSAAGGERRRRRWYGTRRRQDGVQGGDAAPLLGGTVEERDAWPVVASNDT